MRAISLILIFICSFPVCAKKWRIETLEPLPKYHIKDLLVDAEDKSLKKIIPRKQEKPIKLLDSPILQNKLFPFYLVSGEKYIHAINRWLRSSGHKYIAWTYSDKMASILEKNSIINQSFSTNLTSSLQDLSNILKQKFNINVFFEIKGELAAVHDFNTPVHLSLVHGATLKEAVKNLVQSYSYIWIESGRGLSWNLNQDLPFIVDYPIVTPKYDIAMALNTVLLNYPLKAQIMFSTHQIFITKD